MWWGFELLWFFFIVQNLTYLSFTGKRSDEESSSF